MLQFGKNILQFLKDVANDERIPARDKKVLLALVALAISPINLMIPLIGEIDEILIISIILDYFFNQLDTEILLDHYPWGMKSFAALRRYARMIAWLTPSKIKDKIWAYEGSPYK